MRPEFDYHSKRAQLARQAVKLQSSGLLLALYSVVGFCLVIGVVLLAFAGSWLGWLVVSLATWPLMILVYNEVWLKHLPIESKPQTVADVLEPELLGKLSKELTPQALAQAVMQCRGGLFFAVRFGLGPNFLPLISSTNPQDLHDVWQKAIALQQQEGASNITAALVLVALIESYPKSDQLVASLQLTKADLYEGVRWYQRLTDLLVQFKKHSNGGGIGRDLSFGYTPTLDRFAVDLSLKAGQQLVRKVPSQESVKQEIIKTLHLSPKPHVLLTGPHGVGKSNVVMSLADDLIKGSKNVPSELAYRQVMALDAAALISVANRPGQLEVLVNQILIEAFKAKNIILFLDNAELFFKSGTGSVDLSNLLMPILENGALKIILAMDDQAWLAISQNTPSLNQRMQRLQVKPLGLHDTIAVCQEHILTLEFKSGVTFMYQSLSAAYRLGGRYVHDLAMPAQAIKILESSLNFAEDGMITEHSIEKAIESSSGVKVASVNQADERETLLNMESKIHERMVNQTRAVSVVSNALRRARSGVRNQNRPIGSFLFLGPTGVGKTELSKALAGVYFGGDERLVRVDMNEFSQPDDVKRLLADGATFEHSLTAQITKQPFSVVLLDEIEKAHPNVLSTLLQMLDEGILRDTNNRQVSFRDAIIIATSNAGADEIRKAINDGRELEDIEKTFVDQLIDSHKFTPEFINRFDDVVLFRPLKGEELLQVVDLIIEGINKTLQPKQIKVILPRDAKQILIDEGNDPRLGARPLRRIVQRTVENIIAGKMLRGELNPGDIVDIKSAEIKGALES